MSSSDLSALVSRLEAVAGRLESAASSGGGGGGGGDGEAAAFVAAYDELIAGPVTEFVNNCNTLGAEVEGQGALVMAAFQAQKAMLGVVAASKKPSDAAFAGIIADTSAALGAVQEAERTAPRKSKQFNHLKAVAECIPGLGWVTVSPKPGPYVKDMKEAGEFYGNRVIKDNKDTDKNHVTWARSYTAIWVALQAYVKEYHTTGLSWNPSGGEASAPASAPAPAPAKPKAAAATSGDGGASRGGMFAELQKGGGVTSGLKKVEKSQMTHKNAALRATSKVSAGAVGSKAAPAKKWGAAAKTYEPVFELQGKKWVVEHQKDNRELVIEISGSGQTVYIYKCEGSTVQIKGKATSITMDGCKKSAVVFEDCVAAFEVINCQSVQCQTTGKVATVSIDKVDGCQVFLSAASIDAAIVSAKSSEMNISVPNPDDPDGDMLEMPIPEQFQTKWNATKKCLVTEPTDIAG